MDLEKVTAKIRPRKQWEALDLGIALTQRYAASLYKIWFIITLPIFLICDIVFYQYSEWVFVLFWLLLPLWERPLLHFLSRELFGERLTVSECVKAFFTLAKIQLFASLTWRRLSLTRSLDLPVIQLEGLKGSERTARLRVIHSIGSGAAVWITILFLLTELILYLSALALAYILLPEPVANSINIFEWAESVSSPIGSVTLDFLLYLAVSFMTPFYVASGFSIYLNQRTHLEAWDIELAFKRLARKLTQKNEYQLTRLAVGMLSIIGLGLITNVSSPLMAAEQAEQDAVILTVDEIDKLPSLDSKTQITLLAPGEESSQHEQVRQQIKEIMRGEDFHNKVQESFFSRRDKQKQTEKPEYVSQNGAAWILLGKLISFLVEFALWIALAMLIIFLLVKYGPLIKGLKAPQRKEKVKPTQLFGLDMQADSLPDDPWQVALEWVEQGNYRAGLSLLYRASLIWFIENTQVTIREGDTELECLQKIRPVAKHSQKQFMEKITLLWRTLAYAHRQPERSQLINLCQEWPSTLNLLGKSNGKIVDESRV